MSGNQTLIDEPLKVGEHTAIPDDIDARIELAKKGGATLAQEPFDVPGIGRIAMVREPGGALIGWMTPSQPEQG